MNGSRSMFKRKGYWLTAFAAAVLLAASPGTAQAQVEITGPDDDEVLEGDTAVYTVDVKGFVPLGGQAGELTVTLTVTKTDANDGEDGEVDDWSGNLGLEYSVVVPEGPADVTGAVPVVFNRSGTIRVPTTHDPDAEDENFTVGFTVSAGGIEDEDQTDLPVAPAEAPNELTINDDETQEYVFDVTTDDPEEGTAINIALRADPAHEDEEASIAMTLHRSDAKYTLGGTAIVASVVTITEETPQAGVAFTLTPPGEDGNRVEDSVTLKAFTGTLGRPMERATITIKVADLNALPAVGMVVTDDKGKVLEEQPTSVEEGTSIYVAVRPLDKDGDADNATEELTVALTPTGTADASDYTLVGTFTIPSSDDISNHLELAVRGEDDDVGTDTLMFDAAVSGEEANGTETSSSPGVLSLMITDATMPKIEAQDQTDAYPKIMEALGEDSTNTVMNPGQTGMIMTSDLFTVIEGYTASYGVSVEGDSVSASASGETITINAISATVEGVPAKVTVTGTARMAGSSFMPDQTISNVSSITFPVTVVDTELVVTVSADPMEIEAGSTTMITATANRAVTAGDGAVAIALAVVPSAGGTLDADSITIAMGDMSGSVTLTANESVTVVATGSGVTGLMQVAVTVTAAPEPEPEPEPVPALPLLGQLLLGLGLLGGGVRHLYRRRQG